MHIRAGAKGSVGFVIFKEKLFLETLDLQTSRVSEAKSLPPDVRFGSCVDGSGLARTFFTFCSIGRCSDSHTSTFAGKKYRCDNRRDQAIGSRSNMDDSERPKALQISNKRAALTRLTPFSYF
jgi:hypothetical protein